MRKTIFPSLIRNLFAGSWSICNSASTEVQRRCCLDIYKSGQQFYYETWTGNFSYKQLFLPANLIPYNRSVNLQSALTDASDHVLEMNGKEVGVFF